MQKITAVAFIYNNDKILVAKRSMESDFMPGIFELPGGHIEEDETIEAGLAREIKEEIGLALSVHNPFYVFTYNNSDNSKQTAEIAYFCTLATQDQQIVLDAAEQSEAVWISAEEVPIYLKENPKEFEIALLGFKYIKEPQAFVNGLK